MIYRQRKRIRKLNYDYSSEGAYFLTICSNGMLRLFGKIENGIMIHNDAGLMVRQKWLDMQRFYPGIKIEALCVMPNHLHSIVRMTDKPGTPQGAFPTPWIPGERGTPRGAFPTMKIPGESGTPRGAFPTLGIPDYMDRFKSLTTRLYINSVQHGNYLPFDKHIWQKSYHDHIIKDENEYRKIFFYIKTNPKRWKQDMFYVPD